jgi:hypothetical protein
MAVAAQAMAIGQLVGCDVWCGVSGDESLIGAWCPLWCSLWASLWDAGMAATVWAA